MGRLIGTTTQYAFLPGKTFTNSYAYDGASNRTSLTLPDASNHTYQYDTLNRLAKITDSLTGQFNFGYDVLSRRTSLTRPNGVNTNYGYDTLSRLLSVLHQSGTTTLDGASYTYDNAGNRTAKTNKLNNVTEQYSYDPLYQVTQVTQGSTTMESYNYDSVGNRLSSLNVSSYSYNLSNELTANSAASFTYDNNGNTLTKTDSTGTRSYAWDFENRLSSVALPGSGGTVSFRYDPSGRRIQKAFTQGSTTTTTNYVYNGASVIEEADASGNLLARYGQGAGIDEPLAELRSGSTVFYEQDGLRSVTSLSNTVGALANTYVYDSFGNLTGTTGALANPFQYTGRDFDPETGLRYYRARYYDSATGRFLSEDPIRFEGGINFYSYVTGNPVNLIDPSGLQSCCNKPCFVDVRCWPIETGHLGLLGFKHCFVTVSDKNCKLHDVSGGPQNGRLFEWDTPPAPHPNALTYSHTEVPCPQVDCITAMAPVITGLNLSYGSADQNSNSGVATMLRSCGLQNLLGSLPAGAWGQSNTLLPKPPYNFQLGPYGRYVLR